MSKVTVVGAGNVGATCANVFAPKFRMPGQISPHPVI